MREQSSFCDRMKIASAQACEDTKAIIKNNPITDITIIGYSSLVAACFAVSEENSCATVGGCTGSALLVAGMGGATTAILVTSAVYTVKFFQNLCTREDEYQAVVMP